MPITITEHGLNPDEPDKPLQRLNVLSAGSAPTALEEPSPWVEPDYTAVAKESELSGTGPFHNWPGPPLVMPAGLLPDGKPWGGDDLDNSYRIEGVRPRNSVEADGCVQAYQRQQDLLRKELGLPRPRRLPPTFKSQDTPETLAVIAEVHRRERARRHRMAG
jgi:hypothetical protein